MGNVGLTQHQTAVVDDADLDEVLKYKWHAQWDRRNHQYVACSRIKDKHVKLHRFIMRANIGVIVDHTNGDSLDNRRCNLRLCDKYQSVHNKPINIRNASGVKGVCWSSHDNRWKVSITAYGTRYHGGYFKSLKAAALKYNEMAMEFHREFAVLNDVSKIEGLE